MFTACCCQMHQPAMHPAESRASPPGAGTRTRRAGQHATTRDKRNKHATRQTRPTRPQPKQQSPRQAARRATRITHAHRPPTDATHTARDNATTDNTRREEDNNAKAAQRQLRRPPHQKPRPTTRAPGRTRNLQIRRHACAEARADASRQQPTTRRIRRKEQQRTQRELQQAHLHQHRARCEKTNPAPKHVKHRPRPHKRDQTTRRQIYNGKGSAPRRTHEARPPKARKLRMPKMIATRCERTRTNQRHTAIANVHCDCCGRTC